MFQIKNKMKTDKVGSDKLDVKIAIFFLFVRRKHKNNNFFLELRSSKSFETLNILYFLKVKQFKLTIKLS